MKKNLDVANLITDFRKSENLTQEQLAERLGYTQGYIADLERGRQKPSQKFFEKLNQVFKGSGHYILQRSVSYQWEQIQKNLIREGVSSPSLERIQGAILAALKLSGDDRYQTGFEKGFKACEPKAIYHVLPVSTKKLVDNLLEILESGNETMINALKSNVKAFLEAVRVGKRKDDPQKEGGQDDEKN